MSLPGFISDLKYLSIYSNSQKAIEQARNLVLQLFQMKQAAMLSQQKQKQNEALALIGIGILFIWVISQK